jgi:serine/threonine protein kinase
VTTLRRVAPTAGAWVTDSIELVAPIAEGAMGKVWVAYHHRLKTRVAVKFVHDKVTGDDVAEARARFEQEAAMAAQIKSPHVVQTYDSGITSDGAPYIVMELLEGQSLGDRLRGAGPLGWSEAAVVIAQVARALTKAHELGIVHRDIKPDNIFVCRNDEGPVCKVLDFGVAKQTRLPAMGGLTTDGKIVGTPEFMCPEMVLEDRPVDYHSDLWALGVVMYVSITGQLPYSGKTLGQLCLNLVNRRPTSPSLLRMDLPPGADEWFARALHRDAAQRFGSARDMAVSFAGVMGNAGTVTDLNSPTLLASALPNSSREPRSSRPPPSFPTSSPSNGGARSLPKALMAGLSVLAVGLLVGAAIVLTRDPRPTAASAAPPVPAAPTPLPANEQPSTDSELATAPTASAAASGSSAAMAGIKAPPGRTAPAATGVAPKAATGQDRAKTGGERDLGF